MTEAGLLFISDEHKEFYRKHAQKYARDPERLSLFYLLGVSDETRRNIRELYDENAGAIIPDGLAARWQTSSSRALCRLAFNLFHGEPVLTDPDADGETLAEETAAYSTAAIFSKLNEWAPYALEALRIRYRIPRATPPRVLNENRKNNSRGPVQAFPNTGKF